MTNNNEHNLFWAAALHKLQTVNDEPPITHETLDRVCDQFPIRHENESIHDWLQRGFNASKRTAQILPFPGKHQKFTKAVEFQRLAAATTIEDFPIPERPLESDDGRFRLTIIPVEGELEIQLESIGMASDQFADKTIGIATGDTLDSIVAVLHLDEWGDGKTRVNDSISVRKALLKPVLGVIDNES